MIGLNKVILVGEVAHAPEIKTIKTGQEIASFNFITTYQYTDQRTREPKEKTERHRIIIFIKDLVEIVRHEVVKGSKLLLEGSLQTRKWNDYSEEVKYVTEILLQSLDNKLILLDSKSNEDNHNWNQ